MQILSRLTDVTAGTPAVLTIGFFDGVHRGHQQLVHRTHQLARQEGARAVLVTLWPHPLAVLRPEEPMALLTTLEEKLQRLAALGELDLAVVMPFTPELARVSPEEYLVMLRDRFHLRGLVEGTDFRFGHERAGDVAWLRRAGEAGGFTVETLDMDAGGERISSSRIRRLVAAGAVDEVTALLGRPYALAGAVVEGERRGRQLGFPTANLRLDPIKLLPGNGVYAVRAGLPSDAVVARPGVANVGVRPTFGEDSPRLVEVHLLDAEVTLYGQQLEVEFVARLREERRFSGLEGLKAQIAADADRARALLAA